MIPFTNHLCNDSFKEPLLLQSFKILEITSLAVCLILSLYFIIASFNGEFGVSTKYNLLAKEKVLANELDLINKETEKIRNRIKRLSDSSLDLELLDQQARIILGMIGEEELIVF